MFNTRLAAAAHLRNARRAYAAMKARNAPALDTYARLDWIYLYATSDTSIDETKKELRLSKSCVLAVTSGRADTPRVSRVPVSRIHHFRYSGSAYDACQCRDDVRNGDILVIESEGVVGLADTWPVAVTVAFGELHRPREGTTLAQCFADRRVSPEAIEAAKAVAEALGYPTID